MKLAKVKISPLCTMRWSNTPSKKGLKHYCYKTFQGLKHHTYGIKQTIYG